MRLSKPIMFADRTQAGRVLADKLAAYTGRADVVVLALPRGGVPVGFEVARSLGVPLDVCSVRKLGVPGHEELAMGAIAGHGTRVVNQAVVEQLGIPESVIDAVAAAEQQELERREGAYRDQLPRPQVRGKVVILVDDGLATGSSMRAAVRSPAARRRRASRSRVATNWSSGSRYRAPRAASRSPPSVDILAVAPSGSTRPLTPGWIADRSP